MFETLETQILLVIVSILIIIIGYLLYKTRKLEQFETEDAIITAINNKYTADIDAIRNLALISSEILNTNNELTIPAEIVNTKNLVNENNVITYGTLNSGPITSSGNITSNNNINAIGNILAQGNINSNGSLSFKNNLCFDDLCINKMLMKKLMSSNIFNAGFATNGGFITAILYEGSFDLQNGNYFLSGSNNTWDAIHINKGWKITLYDGVFTTILAEYNNLILDAPRLFTTNLQDKISSYKAEFIGY